MTAPIVLLPPCLLGASRLRLQTSLAELTRDLDAYVPGRMRAGSVPGLAVALVRGGRVVWTRGFGVTNVLTREPVTEDTVFLAGANGEPVAAYASLVLVDQGKLALDRSLNGYLGTAFLPESRFRDEVTLRRVLSHTSGLSNRVDLPDDRSLRFPPGERFGYGGMGYSYLTELLAAQYGGDFETALESLVLGRLGMESSSFVASGRLGERETAIHLPLWQPLVAFTALFAAASIVCWLAAYPTIRWLLRRRVSKRSAGVVTVLAILLASVGGAVEVGVATAAFCGVLFLALYFLLAGMWALTRWSRTGRVLVLGGVLAVLWLAREVPLGLPPFSLPEPNAAYSLRSTAPDLGRFLMELLSPSLLSEEMAHELRAPQAEVSERLSWGLGIGIARTEAGKALWHWGRGLGAESLMVAYPEAGMAIVVLTNAVGGLEVAADVAQRALGGERPDFWKDVSYAW